MQNTNLLPPPGMPPLPPGWVAQWDENYASWYFVDTRTHISQWGFPGGTPIASRPSSADPAQYSKNQEAVGHPQRWENVPTSGNNMLESDAAIAARLQAEENAKAMPNHAPPSAQEQYHPQTQPAYSQPQPQHYNNGHASYSYEQNFNNGLAPPGSMQPASATPQSPYTSPTGPPPKKNRWGLPTSAGAGGGKALGALGGAALKIAKKKMKKKHGGGHSGLGGFGGHGEEHYDDQDNYEDGGDHGGSGLSDWFGGGSGDHGSSGWSDMLGGEDFGGGGGGDD